MKKILIIFALSLLFLTGCASKELKRYERISNIIIGLYRSDVYDAADLDSDEVELIENHLSELKRDNPIVSIERLINRSSETRVNEPNSPEIIVKDGRCYVNFAELQFPVYDPLDYAMEPGIELICNGYSVYIYESDFGQPYNEIIRNPLFDYNYYGYKKVEEGYKFMYTSNYDGTGLSVYVITDDKKVVDIEVVFERVERSSNPLWWIIPISIIVLLSIGVVLFLMKRKSKK